ncbi:Peptidase family M28 [Polaribacter sp. KT25b]|uniref:M28 family peptidase n=1 Tax=Polaribacter sp. KT25b TaxID=1855336 RepID=UPI00087A6DCD|nr:M28 family peptidase [Polaribacter sp. KT25b]SDS22451.1 Peptidase family M28 [Polaribacter sp. KT25b]
MKINYNFIAALLLIICSCSRPKEIDIDNNKLLENIKILSNDTLEGRYFSTPGNYKAQKFIIRKFKEIGLKTFSQNNYLQTFSYTFKGQKRQDVFPVKKDLTNVPDTTAIGGNILGMLKGQTNKSIVITAHFDHLGIKDGKIFNGADDNASGTAALFTIAEYFKNKPIYHNLIFAAVDAEEIGSLGAEYFLKNFNDKKNIALNINLDMIAHSDYDPELFACGLYHYPDLRKPLKRIKSDKVILLFGHDAPEDKDQSDWTFSSDHRVFHREKIPFIYFGVPDHKDYHRSTDTFATINTDFYIESVKIIIQAIENFDEYLKD